MITCIEQRSKGQWHEAGARLCRAESRHVRNGYERESFKSRCSKNTRRRFRKSVRYGQRHPGQSSDNHGVSVTAVKLLAKEAIKNTNDRESFILLMNEILIGSDVGAPNMPPRKYERIKLGDLGMNKIYQDHTPYQMTHLWSYVYYGFATSGSVAKMGNVFHETFDFKLKKGTPPTIYHAGTTPDYYLGLIGISLGQDLRKYRIPLPQFPDELEIRLRRPYKQ